MIETYFGHIILIMGPTAAGKSTTIDRLKASYPNKYTVYELDTYIANKLAKPDEGVVDYFLRVGGAKFHQDSWDCIEEINNKHYDSEQIILIDVGGGSIYGHHAAEFPDKYCCLLLSADPEYLWERQKSKDTHDTLDAYKMWQFDFKKIMFDKCQIKIDVSYLTIGDVYSLSNTKITNYLKSIKS